ncbi:unnamed protein product [Bemisia tabaci]|uniref:Gamma-aminobutyric acid type B receptor subunit 2 n=1 Tax=Bemisia tabaci TaxID=7038 RepID=A0A9P0F3I4_BEMTA|nr:unnamed protein product [Bemisia tabaci]
MVLRKRYVSAVPFIGGIAILCSLLSTVIAGKCLTDIKDVEPKRYLNYGDHVQGIRIETSDRITHQLASHVFKIFLDDVLGYEPSAEIVYEPDYLDDTTAIVERLSGVYLNDLQHPDYRMPDTMVNLETWIPTYFRTPLYTSVSDLGNVAPPGRLGWFIQTSLASKNMDLDSWKTFKDPEKVKKFAFAPEDFGYLSNFTRDSTNDRYFCESTLGCHQSVYTPSRCVNMECALFLAAKSEETGFVINDIEKLGLYAQVVWVGPNLGQIVSRMVAKYESMSPIVKSVVVVGWTPSDVIPDIARFTPVTFPPCNSMDNTGIGCKYEMQRLAKLAWPQLQKVAEPVYEAVKRFELSPNGYHDILNSYHTAQSPKNISEIACTWMKANRNTWKTWIHLDNKNVIYIGGIFPLGSTTYNGRGIFVAADMARAAINRNESLLHGYELRVSIQDGKCETDNVMRAFIEYMRYETYNRLIGILGPACSETLEPLAGVAVHYRTVVVSYSAEGASFASREKSPYFFRTVGENKQFKYVYLQLFNALEWKKVAALTEDGQKYTEYISNLQDLLQNHGINFVANRKFPPDREPDAMSQYLLDLKSKSARIIIADVNEKAAREVMCTAYRLRMTAKEGYVWFLPPWHGKSWYDTDHYNQAHENVTCTTDQMTDAINGYFSLTTQFFGPPEQMMQENKTIAQWQKEYKAEVARRKFQESNYAGFAYDAVWMYALAMNKLIKKDHFLFANFHSNATTTKFVKLMSETDFYGVSGHISFKAGRSRPSVVNVMQWINNKTVLLGTYHPNASDSMTSSSQGFLRMNISQIVWLTSDGKKPDDGTVIEYCIFGGVADMLDIDCGTAIIIVNIIGFGLSTVILLALFLTIRHRYAKKMELAQKYMRTLGIDLLSPSVLSDLDKWEIPREHVVINRKLGEGAFGTVYGGEALFGSDWMAVAVKTLKIGSTTEEKLDFLSEAELMKRFNHPNIVKLLGVCTKNEPIYNVMEFMLYGDLKTYLLARRHIVNEQSKNGEESDEVSSKRLTQMALDIARALSYLAENKYVHRDVASRNCLINAQRTTKLGDFGMTRPTFENDYYKFNRKGMLPVRWMAPESLVLGIFTPESDVWSFGVLLYEILTFGNFPFQGMTNNQVLEHVKAGNTLVIPAQVKPEVKELLKSCWNIESKKRPSASTLMETLINNPRLLSPCLDTPISSVQIEHPQHPDFDVKLTEKPRKRSVVCKPMLKRGFSQPNAPVWPITQEVDDLIGSNSWMNDSRMNNSTRLWTSGSLNQDINAGASDPLLFDDSGPAKYIEMSRKSNGNLEFSNYDMKNEHDSIL